MTIKTCTACKQALTLDAFPRRTDAPNATHRSRCKSCHYKINSARDPVGLRAAQDAWREANKAARNVKARVINARARARNPEKHKEYSRRTYLKNPTAYVIARVKRDAAKLQATPSWANEFFISEAYHLAKVRERVCGGKWHVDHIVPLRGKLVCGLHVEHNLQVIPATMNLRKNNRHWPDMPC